MNPFIAYLEMAKAKKAYGCKSQQYFIAYHEWMHAVFLSMHKAK